MATAITAAAKKPPPSSPFAELLRRSKFAKYDPAIRQTYSSPPANAFRGDWGLKRPIALRRKNGYIALPEFESAAQYIPWNHAESQVRFVRRVEEMGAQPYTLGGTPWDKGLGKAKTQWLVDSEFCPEEGHELENQNRNAIDTRLGGLGLRGPGQYGMKSTRRLNKDSHVTPNIDAMSPKQFARYLKKLRELRPAFREHLNTVAAKNNPGLAQKSMYDIARDPFAAYHRKFLAAHTAQLYGDLGSHKIEQQPHPNGGLMYSHPTPLDTLYKTKPQPGIVLQTIYDPHSERYNKHTIARKKENYIASFGGLTATLANGSAGGKKPLLDPHSEKGVDQSRISQSIGNMRLAAVKGLTIERPPKVVGRVGQGLKAVRLKAAVVATDASMNEFGKDNPHFPGTPEYNAMDARSRKALPADFTSRAQAPAAPSLVNFSRPRRPVDSIVQSTLSQLKDMMGPRNSGSKGSEGL